MAAHPHVFTIPLKDFDLSLIPASARRIGTDDFREAVNLYYGTLYASKGMTAIVSVDDERVSVAATPQGGISPYEFALELLNDRKIEEALPILELLKSHSPDDPDILYNLGLGYSELGRMSEAITELEHCVKADPEHVNAWVGLGVAYRKEHRDAEAEQALHQAITLDPGNGWAQRNLGAVLMAQGKAPDALPHFREAVHQLPDDPAALFGLAQCLEAVQGQAEAAGIYVTLIKRFPNHPIAEMAREASTGRAHRTLRGAVDGSVRMDVVMFIVDALEKFSKLSKNEIGHIALEIAVLGRSGLQINDPDKIYRLKTLAGEYTGLHLLALMHAGMKLVDENVDTGADFDKEFDIAKAMAGKK